jgi:stage IV sporulation protein FB
MGFEDRDYYRDGPRGGTGLSRVGQWLLYGRVHLFRAFEIDVSAHSSLIIAMVLTLLIMGGGYMWQDRVIASLLLFVIVLLHEFGHCFGARWSGGDADQIVMHPLGGLALTQPLSTWRSHLITSMAGPLVNVAFCVICAAALFAITGHVPWLPYFFYHGTLFRGWLDPVWLLFWIFQTNYVLLLFNLLPIYPLDGGQITQAALWPRVGYYKSMWLAVNTGLVGAVIVAMVAVATAAIGLFLIAALGFMYCLQMKRMLQEQGPFGFSEYDEPYAQELQRAQRENRSAARTATRRTSSRTAAKVAKRAEQERRQAEEDEREIDRILAKVSASGMHTLTRGEQKTLKQASERRRR